MADTTTALKQRTVTNYRSKGGSVEVIDEIPVAEMLAAISAVRTNSNGTPYVWIQDGSPDGSAMAYMSTAARDLCEQHQNQLSRSQHAVQVWEKTTNVDGKEVKEEFYVISLVGEEVSASEATYVD